MTSGKDTLKARRTLAVGDRSYDYDSLEVAAAHYAQALDKALSARNYLAKRGLCEPDLLKQFQIGYGDGTIKTVIGRAR